MSVTLDVNIKNAVTGQLKKIQKKLDLVPKEAYTEFVSETPIRSGNARRNTRLEKNKIKAQYPYAKRLDDGYSKQSPQGMTEPTVNFIKKRVAQILKGK